MFIPSNIDNFDTWFAVYKLQSSASISFEEQMRECWQQAVASCNREEADAVIEKLKEKNDELEKQLRDYKNTTSELAERLEKIRSFVNF